MAVRAPVELASVASPKLSLRLSPRQVTPYPTSAPTPTSGTSVFPTIAPA